MGLPSRFFEKKFVKDGKGDDITPFDGTYWASSAIYRSKIFLFSHKKNYFVRLLLGDHLYLLLHILEFHLGVWRLVRSIFRYI
jgi:hypothetical protein